MVNKTLKIPIKSKKLFRQAFTHRSWLNENERKNMQSNERLEFLGDAVLELIVTEYLYKEFSSQQEGTLTTFRAALVRTETLAKVARHLHLGDSLHLSKGEKYSGGKNNSSLLANTLEAVIGAIYLESGKKTATSFIKKLIIPELQSIIDEHLEKDPKSQLQEIVQAQSAQAPAYKVIKETGPDHNKTFTISVSINGKKIAKGIGKSKQQAQQKAAQSALEKYSSN